MNVGLSFYSQFVQYLSLLRPRQRQAGLRIGSGSQSPPCTRASPACILRNALCTYFLVVANNVESVSSGLNDATHASDTCLLPQLVRHQSLILHSPSGRRCWAMGIPK